MLKNDSFDTPPQRLPIIPASGEEMQPEQADKFASRMGDIVKYSLIALVTAIAFYFLYEKVQDISPAEVRRAVESIPPRNIALAFGFTAANFCLMTGYDLIAVRYLKKRMPIRRVLAGAVIGYAFSNVFGWLLGGTAVRYRLYSRWGFSPVEIIAFITILSITFWLGMFLLAGIAFTVLPIKLQPKAERPLWLDHHVWGYIFLSVVGVYLAACALIRKPIRWRNYRYSLPPLPLSVMQLIVSAGDFVLTSAVLYVLLPPALTGPDAINFSTVLVSYLTAMIFVVLTHVPGGVGVLETALLIMLPESAKVPVVAAVLLFRVVYYLIPAAIAGLLWGSIEATWRFAAKRKRDAAIAEPEPAIAAD